MNDFSKTFFTKEVKQGVNIGESKSDKSKMPILKLDTII